MDFDEIFGGVGRGPGSNRLGFGGDPTQDSDRGFLNLDKYPDPDGFR